MRSVGILIRKCKNGYYLRIYDGFWRFIPQRFVATSDEQVTDILKPFLQRLREA